MNKILAIDDKQDNLISIKALIKNYMSDCEVITSQSGKEGIYLAKTKKPDVILLDIIMPEMDGYAVCSELRNNAETRHIPIILITAIKTDSESRIKGLEVGADAFLSKPIDPNELTAQINVALRIKHAEDKLRQEKVNLEELVFERTSELTDSYNDLRREVVVRKQTEVALKDSEEKFRSITEQVSDMIYLTDDKGVISYISPPSIKLFGYEPSKMIGQPFMQFLNESDIPKAIKHFQETIQRDLPTLNLELQMKHKNGTIFVGELTGKSYKSGNSVGTIGVIRNITERKLADIALKKSEEQLRNIFENSTNMFYSHDTDHVLNYVSPQVMDILGYTQEEALQNWTNFVSDNPINDIGYQTTLNAIKSGKSQPTYELELVRKDNRKIFVEVRESPVLKDGKTIGIVGSLTDITDRKLAEEKMKTSEENYRILAENAKHLIITHDLDGKITYANNFALDFMNIKRDQIIGQNIVQFIHSKEDLTAMKQRQHDFVTGKNIVHYYELNVKSASGEDHILEVYGNPIKQNDKINSVLLVAYDITERKKAEERLKESEENFRALYDNAPLPYQSLNEDGSFQDVNPAWLKTLGYKRDEIIGKFYQDFLHPDWQPHFEKNFPEFKKRGYVSNIQFKIRHKDGHYLDISFEGCIGYNPDGSVRQTYCVFQDITDRLKAENSLLESENRYKDLVEMLPEAVLEADLNLNITYVNQRALEMSGYSEEDVQNGLNGFDLLTPESRSLAKEHFRMRLEGSDPGSVEYYARKKDGKIYPILFHANSVIINGKAKGIRGLIVDITERKQAEEQLKRNLEEKNTLLKELYHRTKNNMQVIVSMLKMQSRRSDNEFINTAFIEIINKINAMALVHQKLYQSQNLSQINLKDYLQELMNLLIRSYSLQSERVSIKLDLQDVIVLMDSAVPLGLILNELISNVFKHAFPNNRKGEICLRLYQEEDGYINIHVEDDGIGVTKDFDLKNVESMGLQTVSTLIGYQLKGQIRYDIENGLKWHFRFKDDQYKERV